MARKWLIATVTTVAICVVTVVVVIYKSNPTNRRLAAIKTETKRLKVIADHKEQQFRIAKYMQLLTPDPNKGR